jgi:effector-binding domain-containing protein
VTYTVQSERHDSVPLAVVRRQAGQADLPRLVPECCGLVWNALRAQGRRGGRHVAVYWDQSIRLEVGVELTEPFAETGDVVQSAMPAGQVVRTARLGPYGGLRGAHDAIHRWCAAQGRQLAGPCWEIYGHWQSAWDANPSQIRTDVFYLLEGVKA